MGSRPVIIGIYKFFKSPPLYRRGFNHLIHDFANSALSRQVRQQNAVKIEILLCGYNPAREFFLRAAGLLEVNFLLGLFTTIPIDYFSIAPIGLAVSAAIELSAIACR